MRLASYVLSFCLHLAAFLLIWFWPSHPPVRLDTPPVMTQPGGTARRATDALAILGHMGEPGDGPQAPPARAKNESPRPRGKRSRNPRPCPRRPRRPRRSNGPSP